LLYHDNSGFENVPPSYVIRTLPVFYLSKRIVMRYLWGNSRLF